MSKVIYRMMMSLDGFINDKHGKIDSLYEDFEAFGKSKIMKEYIETIGSVVMGRRSYEMSENPDWYADNYEHQVPLYVVTHHPPALKPKENNRLKFNFVTDGVGAAIRQAKLAAGDKNVAIIGGASIAAQALDLQLIDELQIDIMPVLLFEGLPLFGGHDMNTLKLERKHVDSIQNGRTQLVYSVCKA